ncbi:MAG TPA: hypothetical protein VFQ53_43235 [Kofleriaceae bacterium]|nr:hypothetical protein [Kofleriaceae bacterium]
MNPAIAQLVRTRPQAKHRVVSPVAIAHEPFDAEWIYEWKPAHPVWRGPLLSDADDEPCWIAAWTDRAGHLQPGVLRRIGDVSELFLNIADPYFAPVINLGRRDDGKYWLTHYCHGADVRTLAATGLALSWTAACCVHGAARFAVRQLHHADRRHGAITPARIRLALFDDHSAVVAAAPVQLVGQRTTRAYVHKDDELAQIARATIMLAHHPDARIDALLRDPDPDALDVLRDLVLERGVLDELLGDALGMRPPPYVDTPAIEGELAALWERVLTLEPLIA